MNTTTHENRLIPGKPRFQLFEVSLELIRCLRPLIDRVRRADGDLGKQLRRAAASIPLNVAEGNRRRRGDRVHLWRVAAGSAAEVDASLRIAEAWGYVDAGDIADALVLVDRVLAMLARLTR